MQQIITSIRKGAIVGADACRLFHGRGHCYPGFEFITIDWFSPILLLTLYKPQEANLLRQLTTELSQFNREPHIRNIVIQHRYLPHSPCESIKGEITDNVDALEKGLKFRLNFKGNQNIGFFLDMANCREYLRNQARNKTVLNLFAYTCAFSVIAAKAGAYKVVNLDMAKGALNTGRLNHQLNNIDTRLVSFLPHNIFKSWGKIKKLGPYDIIIVDPPSYQTGSFDAKKDYKKIVEKLNGLLTTKGKVIACLNSPDLDFDFLRNLFSKFDCFEEIENIPTPISFPEAYIEKGLKTLVFAKMY